MSDVAFDLGTANAWVVVPGRGPVAHVPSLVVRDPRTGALMAAGEDARQAIRRESGELSIQAPLRAGDVADPEAARALVGHLLALAHPGRSLLRPRVLVSVPGRQSPVARAALERVLRSLNPRALECVPAPIAAASGAGLDPDEPRALLVADVGAGVSDVAVVSMGSLLAARTVAAGGQRWDRAVAAAVRAAFRVEVGLGTAERLKVAVGSLDARSSRGALVVTGRDVATGMPRQVAVSSGDLRGALAAAAEPLLSAIRDVLTQVSPEAAADIADAGLVLTGGASMLHGLDRHLGEAFELPVVRAEDPCAAVARGLHRILGRSEAPRRGRGRIADPRPVGLRRNFHG